MGEVIWTVRFTAAPLTDRELAACRALAAFKRWHHAELERRLSNAQQMRDPKRVPFFAISILFC
jgi:hypothetical protein